MLKTLLAALSILTAALPARAEGDGPVFDESEIVVGLHDESEMGRLFKMKAW